MTTNPKPGEPVASEILRQVVAARLAGR